MDSLLEIGWEGHVLGRYIIGIILLQNGVKDELVAQENIQFMSAKSLSMYIDSDAVLHLGCERRRPPSAGGWKWGCTTCHMGRKRNDERETLFGRCEYITWRTREDNGRRE
jgi:hypothetical protein